MPERIEIDTERSGRGDISQVSQQRHRIIYVLFGPQPLSEIADVFQASEFDRYIQKPFSDKVILDLL